MADATGTYRRDLARPSSLRLEKYLGLVGAAAGAVGVAMVFGFDAIWHSVQHVLGTLYLLAVVIAG